MTLRQTPDALAARDNGPSGNGRWTRSLGWLVYALAVIGGAGLGFHFGVTVSGMSFGLLTAALSALFCSIVADALVSRFLWRARRP